MKRTVKSFDFRIVSPTFLSSTIEDEIKPFDLLELVSLKKRRPRGSMIFFFFPNSPFIQTYNDCKSIEINTSPV